MKIKGNQKGVSLKAAVAKDIITPPIGTSLAGYAFKKEGSVGIHDELFVRAVVLEQGKTRVALAVSDIIGFERFTVEKVRKMVEDTTGIPHQNVIVAATHTHSGPVGLFGFKEYKGILSSVSGAYMGDKLDRSLVEILVRKIVGAIQTASARMKEVRVGTLIGRVEEIGKNRRNPADISDPDVTTTLIEGAHGPLSILYSYACHPTVLHQDNRLISADFPGRSNLQLERTLKTLPIYMTGAAGDISTRYTRRDTNFQEIERLGSILADEVLKIANKIAPKDVSCMSIQSKRVQLPVKRLPSLEETQNKLNHAKQHLAQLRNQQAPPAQIKTAETQLEGAQMTINLLKKSKITELKSIEIEIQLLTIGDTGVLAIPGELFVQPGNYIKEYAQSKNLHLHICCYANGYIGYIPTKEAFEDSDYESSVAIVGPRAASILVEATKDLLGV